MTSVESKNVDDEQLRKFVAELYNVNNVTQDELKLWNDAYSYKGFDRLKVIKDFMKKVPDVKTAQQIIMICGLSGPQRASLTKLINGKTIGSYGIPASGLKGSDGVSCQRITAATADLCAFLLKQVNIPKRLNTSLPGWLQFPSAGSIKMPVDIRNMHIEFARRFSTVIGGQFNEQIYEQMMANSYLDDSLKLFDNVGIYFQQQASSLTLPTSAPTFNPNIGDVNPPKTSESSRVKPAGRG